MNYWHKGMTWPTDTLRATAYDLFSRSGALTTNAKRSLACRMPSWVGTAADIAKVDRELWAARQSFISEKMLAKARLDLHGADELESLQAQMRSLKQRLEARGFIVSATGSLKAPPDVKAYEYESASRSISALSIRVERLDTSIASAITTLTSKTKVSRQNISDLDDMNAIRLNALEDVTWKPSLRRGYAALNPTRRQALLTSLRRGELPRGIYHQLINGVAPSLTERLAFTAYTAANSPFWDFVLKNWGTVTTRRYIGPLMYATWGNFMADGKPLTPKLLEDQDVTTKPAFEDIPGLIAEFETVADEMRGKPHAQIQVSVTVDAAGEPHFTVIIPGTAVGLLSYDGWNQHPKGLDWPANLKGKGFSDSAVTQSIAAGIEEAIRKYEVDTGKPLQNPPKLLLAGHSQGGIVATNLVADPTFSAKFRVEHVLTIGSPVEDIEVPSHTKVTNLANQNDPVPRLDGDLKEFTRPIWRVIDAASPLPCPGPIIDALRPSWTPPDNYQEIRFLNKDHPDTNVTIGQKINPFDDHGTEMYATRVKSSLRSYPNTTLTSLNDDLSPYLKTEDEGGRIVYTAEVGRR